MSEKDESEIQKKLLEGMEAEIPDYMDEVEKQIAWGELYASSLAGYCWTRKTS